MNKTYILATIILFSACTTTIDRVEDLTIQEKWSDAVISIRSAYAKNPRDLELKSRLKQIELKAADYYYQKGVKSHVSGSLEKAIENYEIGLTAMPEHSKLTSALQKAMAQKSADILYLEALSNIKLERHDDAIKLLLSAQKLSPGHIKIEQKLNSLILEQQHGKSKKFALTSNEAISLKFRKTDIRTAFEFLAKSFGLNVIFDESVKTIPVTLFAEQVPFQQALNLLLTTTKSFYKKIGSNTILIAPDTAEKRGQYEDQIVRSFHLKSMKAKDMERLIKNILSVKKIIVNEHLNTLIIRDSIEVLDLTEKLIEINDTKPAEVILDVEILEVNRTKSERLGLDVGQRLSLTYAGTETSTNFSDAFQQGRIIVSPVTFNYFKQNVDAKTLANPKIRVLNNKPAKVHIGDRVPLRSSTVQDATGQTRTTFQYTDIGIKLNVEPQIHADNSVTINLKLEVSSLGQNLGTPNEPAFSIGTRNAETHMLLRDGETAILGGLIRDEDRKNRIKVPGFGSIPILGALFTSKDDSQTRTDVLLTITPRVVRPWTLKSKEQLSFFSGSLNRLSNTPLFSYLDLPIPTTPSSGSANKTSSTSKNILKDTLKTKPSLPTPSTGKETHGGVLLPSFKFDHSEYDVVENDQLNIKLMAGNLTNVASIDFEIIYNADTLEFIKGNTDEIKFTKAEFSKSKRSGLLKVSLLNPNGIHVGNPESSALISFTGLKTGNSYILIKNLIMLDREGNGIKPQLRASRVLIK